MISVLILQPQYGAPVPVYGQPPPAGAGHPPPGVGYFAAQPLPGGAGYPPPAGARVNDFSFPRPKGSADSVTNSSR